MTPNIPRHFDGIVTYINHAQDTKARSIHPWTGIIIHHTGLNGRPASLMSVAMWKELFKNITTWLSARDTNYLSAHFHIGRFGECAMLADPDSLQTFHAGESSYFHPEQRKMVDGWNQYAIGIELLGDGNEGRYTEEQYDTLAKLCAVLYLRYRQIDPRCITGHENISAPRKSDPGSCFDWRKFFLKFYAEVSLRESALQAR